MNAACLSPRPKVRIAGVPIDPLTFDEMVELVLAHARERRAPTWVVTPNAHHVHLYQRDQRLQDIYKQAGLSAADGVPLIWAARFLGQPLPGRVNGTDLMEALCGHPQAQKLKIFFLGGRPGAAETCARRLQERHPRLNIAGWHCPPYGFEQDPQAQAELEQAVNTVQPDLLFVGLGSPKQEYWMAEHVEPLGVPIALGIGVSFEFIAGMVQRAPIWMQRTGLEWLYRLFREPRHLFRRYLIGNTHFVWLVLRQRMFGNRAEARPT